jgi:hypothetical protein
MIEEEKAALRLIDKINQVLIDPKDLMIPFEAKKNY